MQKIFKFICNILLVILMTLLSPILFWIVFNKIGKVKMLLDYGRIGTFYESIRVETKSDNVLWQGKSGSVPKAILSMNVYNYWAEYNAIVIKVYRDDRKIAKLRKEIKEDSYV